LSIVNHEFKICIKADIVYVFNELVCGISRGAPEGAVPPKGRCPRRGGPGFAYLETTQKKRYYSCEKRTSQHESIIVTIGIVKKLVSG
jgi:hypothetical protein